MSAFSVHYRKDIMLLSVYNLFLLPVYFCLVLYNNCSLTFIVFSRGGLPEVIAFLLKLTCIVLFPFSDDVAYTSIVQYSTTIT